MTNLTAKRPRMHFLVYLTLITALSACVENQDNTSAPRITEIPEWNQYVSCLQQSAGQYGGRAPLADASLLAANACQGQAAILADSWGRSRGLTRSGRADLRQMLFDWGVTIAADFITQT